MFMKLLVLLIVIENFLVILECEVVGFFEIIIEWIKGDC